MPGSVGADAGSRTILSRRAARRGATRPGAAARGLVGIRPISKRAQDVEVVVAGVVVVVAGW